MSEKFKNKFISIQNKKIEIGKFIGEGSLGGTWEIKNELGYPKVLKVLYKVNFLDNLKFTDKLKIIKTIKHPNILNIDSFGILSFQNMKILASEGTNPSVKIADYVYIIMPYASINLADYIVMHKENFVERTKLSLQLLQGIRKIHSFRIYDDKGDVQPFQHGNIKFSNLLLVIQNNSYTLKIADLGMAINLNTNQEPLHSHILFDEKNDFVETQKILEEFLHSHENFLEQFPKIIDHATLDTWIHKLKSIEKKLRLEKLAKSSILLGIQLYEKNMFDYALKDFEKATSICPQMYDAHLYKAHTLRELGKWQLSLSSYDKAISINNLDARGYEGKGELFIYQDKTEEAIQNFKKAIELNTNLPFCHANLGAIYKNLKKYDLAAQEFSSVLALEEDCVPAHVDRGDIFFALEQYSNALKDYEKALELDPENETIKIKYDFAKEKIKNESK